MWRLRRRATSQLLLQTLPSLRVYLPFLRQVFRKRPEKFQRRRSIRRKAVTGCSVHCDQRLLRIFLQPRRGDDLGLVCGGQLRAEGTFPPVAWEGHLLCLRVIFRVSRGILCAVYRRIGGPLFSPSCLLCVVRLIRHFGEDRVVCVRVWCFVTGLARCQVIRLRRAWLRAAAILTCFHRQLTYCSLLTVVEFGLLRGLVHALRGTFQRAHRFYCVSAREILAAAAFRFAGRSCLVVRLFRQCIVILSALREFFRFVRFIMVHNRWDAYFNFQVFISVFRGHPNGESTVVHENAAPRLIG